MTALTDLSGFSSEELRKAGVIRDRCSEPVVCRDHGHAPRCELCELETDPANVCVVCGAEIPAGAPAGTARQCQSAKVLAGRGGRSFPRLTPAMQSSLAAVLAAREKERARREREREARLREAALLMADRGRAEAEADTGVFYGLATGLALVILIVFNSAVGGPGDTFLKVMALIGAVIGLVIGLSEGGGGGAIGGALLGGLAGWLLGMLLALLWYLLTWPTADAGPIGIALWSAGLLLATGFVGGLLAQIEQTARVVVIVALTILLLGTSWGLRPV